MFGYDEAFETAKKIRGEMAVYLIGRSWAEDMTVREVTLFLSHMEDFTRSRLVDLIPTTPQTHKEETP